ncbi:RNA-binding protein 44 [Parus major]|uniref:RNA-binding protein 44 n=1 Tax=Parus major TaxID=9157 RepID=UPI0007715D84|nr:RNA-binding protein 44 [Parus major]
MEVEKSSKRSCFTQTSCLGEDLGEDSQLEYLSAYEECEEDKNNSSEFSEQGEVEEVKKMPLIGDKAGDEESGKSQRPTHSVAVEPDIPFLPPREKAQLCKGAEPSDFSSCEKPAVCTRGASSADSPAERAETQLPVPEIPPSKNPVAATEAADKSSGGSPGAVESEQGEALRSVPGVSTAVQAVDDSGFPTSRGSSAQVCLCSRAVNTEITMMNKTRPVGWLGQTSVDAASNTEWSFRAWSSHMQQESKDDLCICDWKTGTNRPEHPNKQTGKNSASGYCQNVLQRAAEAELQLLAIHYKMCFRHCLKVFELALEEITYFGRCEEKSELYSSLLLVLNELDSNYSNMRMEINMGIPLNELPPLSVELKFSPISSFYVPSKFLRKSVDSEQVHDRTCSGTTSSDFLDLSGEGKADPEDPKSQEKGISVNMDKLETDGDQPGGSACPETWEEQPKDQALERGCVKNEEGSEYWFDAKEDLSVADISVKCREMKKQQGKQDSIDSREMKTVGSGNEHSSAHVGGLKPSVPEEPGENSLQKTSTCSSVNPSGIFVSPYALNLSSFTKLIKRLQEKHPEFSRAEIVEAVQEVRKINKGVLSGLAISSIEEKTSAILRRSMR